MHILGVAAGNMTEVMIDLTDRQDQTVPRARPLSGVADIKLGSNALPVERGQELPQALPRPATKARPGCFKQRVDGLYERAAPMFFDNTSRKVSEDCKPAARPRKGGRFDLKTETGPPRST